MHSRFVTDLPPASNYGTFAPMLDVSVKLDQVFREEYGRIIATLIRISGSFDLAEEALQEAFAVATEFLLLGHASQKLLVYPHRDAQDC